MTMYKDLTSEQKKAKNADHCKSYYQRTKEKNPDVWKSRIQRCVDYNRENYSKQEARIKRTLEPWKVLLTNAKSRAKKKGLDFSITESYIKSIWVDRCPILGIDLVVSANRCQDNSYSLDRIDSTKGYVEGNVMVVSYRANVIKNMGTAEEHRLIAEWMESKQP